MVPCMAMHAPKLRRARALHISFGRACATHASSAQQQQLLSYTTISCTLPFLALLACL